MSDVGGFRVQRQGDAVELRRPQGGRRGLGAAVLLLTAWFTWSGLTGNLSLANGAPFPPLLVAAVSAGMGILGLAMVSCRSWIRFDPDTDTAQDGFRVLGLGSSTVHNLEDFSEVDVRRVVTSNGSEGGSSTSYPVRLVGEKPWTVGSPSSPLAARRLAELVAKATGKPLRNELAGEAVVRLPEHLDFGVRERLRRQGLGPETPVPPGRSKLEVSSSHGVLTVSIPRAGFLRAGGLMIALLLPGIVIAGAMLPAFLRDAPWPVVAFASTLVALPFVLVGIIASVRGLRTSQLEVTRHDLRIVERWPWRTRERTLSADEVEEVATSRLHGPSSPLGNLIAHHRVAIFTDLELIELGLGLAADDVAYLRALIETGLCGEAPPPAATSAPLAESAPSGTPRMSR